MSEEGGPRACACLFASPVGARGLGSALGRVIADLDPKTPPVILAAHDPLVQRVAAFDLEV